MMKEKPTLTRKPNIIGGKTYNMIASWDARL